MKDSRVMPIKMSRRGLTLSRMMFWFFETVPKVFRDPPNARPIETHVIAWGLMVEGLFSNFDGLFSSLFDGIGPHRESMRNFVRGSAIEYVRTVRNVYSFSSKDACFRPLGLSHFGLFFRCFAHKLRDEVKAFTKAFR